MNKKQAGLLEEILDLQGNAEELLKTKQARIINFEKVVAVELEERVKWRIGEFLEEARAF